ncbi:sigma-70 family RNA polymerase sigma factor [Pseudooceanicola sp.]|uniref:sigma-70 family RNA polymerase sigma factor n=1 Tax=Pseudooceanicola sp. TaxID=1914328 RepID=UPI0035C67A17
MSHSTRGTEDDFDIIEHIPTLRGFAWALTRRHEDVDDLVQETLTKAIAKSHLYRRGTNLRAWLVTIMRNTFYNDVAKRSRERTGQVDCVSSRPSTKPTQEWSLRGKEMQRVIAEMPAHYREILIFVVMLGGTYEDATEVFGIAMGTVKSRVARARAIVLEELGEDRLENI